jgi:hypothetical protein
VWARRISSVIPGCASWRWPGMTKGGRDAPE